MCCDLDKKVQKTVWAFSIGALLLIIALILGVLWPIAFRTLLYKQLKLKNGTMAYKNWIEPINPTYYEVYIFNWTNLNQINEKNFKPNFTEYGPLVFIENGKHEDIEWNSNKISYYQNKNWKFMPELSKGNLSEKITYLNVMTATVVQWAKTQKTYRKRITDYMLIKKGSFSTTETVERILFSGFKDTLLRFIKKFNSPIFKYPYDKYGWYITRNLQKTYGQYEINSGINSVKDIGKIEQWNHTKFTYYYGRYCNMINGSTGELWPPLLNPQQYITIFLSDICRSINFYPAGDFIHFDIEGKVWMGTKETFDNGDINKDNICFCRNKNLSACPQTGLCDISNCFFNAPFLVSFPHFMSTDANLVNEIEGVHPEKWKHESHIAIEPTTGVVMSSNITYQINIKLQYVENITLYENVKKDYVLPLFWLKKRNGLDIRTAIELKDIIVPPHVGIIFSYMFASFGTTFILAGLLLFVLN